MAGKREVYLTKEGIVLSGSHNTAGKQCTECGNINNLGKHGLSGIVVAEIRGN